MPLCYAALLEGSALDTALEIKPIAYFGNILIVKIT
jgi:hypothetical protein